MRAVPQPAVRPQRRPVAPISAAPRGLTWGEAVDLFLASKRAENLSPATLENYEWHLRGSRARIFLADHAIVSPRQLDTVKLERIPRELWAAGTRLARCASVS